MRENVLACQLFMPTKECRRKRPFDSVLAKNHVFKMKQDGRRLVNQTPREIINMDRKTELKIEVKRGVSTLYSDYSYKKNNILQNNKSCHQQSFVNKIT